MPTQPTPYPTLPSGVPELGIAEEEVVQLLRGRFPLGASVDCHRQCPAQPRDHLRPSADHLTNVSRPLQLVTAALIQPHDHMHSSVT